MQFKYPELLYALFVLIIPILVHLLQLQRYTKVPFTNVQLLQNIEKETRKSAKLKKWLVLLTRLLAMACLILAFAQPFTSAFNSDGIPKTAIYIDNSFSMKAKGTNGELLRSQINAILENGTYQSEHLSFHTNFNSFNQSSEPQLKEALINLSYQPYPVKFENELLRLNLEKKTRNFDRLVIISDFQSYQYTAFPELLKSLETETVLMKTTPVQQTNIWIDSVYTSNSSATTITVNALIKSQYPLAEAIAVNLYSGPTIYGKTSVSVQDNDAAIVSFNIPTDKTFYGKFAIEDQSLAFDNDFYFVYNVPETIDILSIGEDSAYLKKIFNQESFNYNNTGLNQLNYGDLASKKFIILNELNQLSEALISEIGNFVTEGGHILLIPSEDANVNSYNQLLSSLNIGSIQPEQTSVLKITDIHFKHPIFNGVFDREVENFQYPSSHKYYLPNFSNDSKILSFQNKAPFMTAQTVGSGQLYYVSSPLSGNASNFKNASLIVPVMYNMAAQSHGIQEIQYPINSNTRIQLNADLAPDQVLTLKYENLQYIPIQKVSKNKVTLELGDQLKKSGIYEVSKGDKTLKRIALNYARNESSLNYVNVKNLANSPLISIANSTENLLAEISETYKINSFFKWFLVFSVLFLFFEMLLLKYFKL